jgi:hypothetical protein
VSPPPISLRACFRALPLHYGQTAKERADREKAKKEREKKKRAQPVSYRDEGIICTVRPITSPPKILGLTALANTRDLHKLKRFGEILVLQGLQNILMLKD